MAASITRDDTRPAARYDEHAVVQRLAARDLLDRTRGRPAQSILEPGCGTGLYTELLLAAFPGASITAADSSAHMLAAAREKLGSRAVCFLLADAEDMAGGPYDLITSNAAFQWFARLPDTLARFAAMLAPGGSLTFSFFGPETYRELDEVLADVAGVRTAASRFADAAALRAMLEAAFARVAVEETRYAQEFASLRDLLLSIRYTGGSGRPARPTLFWTPAKLDRVERACIERHGGIRATYQVFLCRAER